MSVSAQTVTSKTDASAIIDSEIPRATPRGCLVLSVTSMYSSKVCQFLLKISKFLETTEQLSYLVLRKFEFSVLKTGTEMKSWGNGNASSYFYSAIESLTTKGGLAKPKFS